MGGFKKEQMRGCFTRGLFVKVKLSWPANLKVSDRNQVVFKSMQHLLVEDHESFDKTVNSEITSYWQN